MSSAAVHVYGMAGWNLGDDAIAVALNRGLRVRLPGAVVRTASIAPGKVHERYGLPEIPVDRRSIGGLLSWAASIRRADVVVIGGGTVVQDALGIGLVRGNLAYASQLVALARAFGKPVLTAGLGVDELRTSRGARYARFVLRRTDHAWMRDARSAELAREYADAEISGLTVGADPAILLRALLPRERPATPHAARAPYLLVSLVREGALADPWVPVLADALRSVLHREVVPRVVLLAMDVRTTEERVLYAQLQNRLQAYRERVELVTPADAFEALAWIEGASVMLAMRLHAMILGLGATPMIGVSRTTKTDTFLHESGIPTLHIHAPPSPPVLVDALRSARDDQGAVAAQRTHRDRMERSANTALDGLAAACRQALPAATGVAAP